MDKTIFNRIFVCIRFVLLISLMNTNCAEKRAKTSTLILKKTETKIIVSIQPIEFADDFLLPKIAGEIDSFYPVKCYVLESVKIPTHAYYPHRNRYRADTLLNFLYQIKNDSIQHIVGITSKDISTSKDKIIDWGVFGLGYMPGPSCVVSSFRLKPKSKSSVHYYERLVKVVLHELGHNFGLNHCTTYQCIMADAEGTIITVDNEKKWLCPVCKSKLCITD